MTTTKTKHTQGPWTWKNNDLHGDHLASESGEIILRGSSYCDVIIPSKEDANLIASAPELLEACKKAFEFLSSDDHGGLEEYDALEKAIAKAEGRI